MKKRFLLMGAAAVLVMATVAGGSLAAGQVSGDQAVKAPLAASDLTIRMVDEERQTLENEAWMPGDVIDLAGDGLFTVENAGSVDSYIRVTVSSFWGVPEEMTADLAQNEEAEIRHTRLGEGWIQAEGDALLDKTADGKQVYYYTKPIGTGDSASTLLQQVALSAALDNSYADMPITISAVADGVQFIGGEYNSVNEDAILAAWGVKATLADDGSILKIEN